MWQCSGQAGWPLGKVAVAGIWWHLRSLRLEDRLTRLCIPVYSPAGCLPANSAESGMSSLTIWHKWLSKMESQEGWISVSVFIKPGCVSPQTKGMWCINAKYHQWASVKVPDRGRRGYNLQGSFSFVFSVSWCHNNQKRKKGIPWGLFWKGTE